MVVSGTERIAVDIRITETSPASAYDRGQPVPAGCTATASIAQVVKLQDDPTTRQIQTQQDPSHPET